MISLDYSSVKVIPLLYPGHNILLAWRLLKSVKLAVKLGDNFFRGLIILLLKDLEHLLRYTFILDVYGTGGINGFLDPCLEVTVGGFLTFKLPEFISIFLYSNLINLYSSFSGLRLLWLNRVSRIYVISI